MSTEYRAKASGQHFDYNVYKYPVDLGHGDRFCAHVLARRDTSPDVTELLARLDNSARLAEVGVCKFDELVVLEIRWPRLQDCYNLRRRSRYNNGVESNMTLRKACRALEKFDAAFARLFEVPEDWPAPRSTVRHPVVARIMSRVLG